MSIRTIKSIIYACCGIYLAIIFICILAAMQMHAQPTATPTPTVPSIHNILPATSQPTQLTITQESGPHTGMMYWSPGQWLAFFAGLGSFIGISLTPFFIMLFTQIKNLRTAAIATALASQNQTTELHTDVRTLTTEVVKLAKNTPPPSSPQ